MAKYDGPIIPDTRYDGPILPLEDDGMARSNAIMDKLPPGVKQNAAALEALGHLAKDIAVAPGAGVHGLISAARSGSLATGADEVRNVMESYKMPMTNQGQRYYDAAGKVFEGVQDFGMEFVQQAAVEPWKEQRGVKNLTLEEEQTFGNLPKMVGEIGIEFAPVPFAGKAAKRAGARGEPPPANIPPTTDAAMLAAQIAKAEGATHVTPEHYTKAQIQLGQTPAANIVDVAERYHNPVVEPLEPRLEARERSEPPTIPYEKTALPEAPIQAVDPLAPRMDVHTPVEGVPYDTSLSLGESPKNVLKNIEFTNLIEYDRPEGLVNQGQLPLREREQFPFTESMSVAKEPPTQLFLEFDKTGLDRLAEESASARAKPPFMRDAVDNIRLAAADEAFAQLARKVSDNISTIFDDKFGAPMRGQGYDPAKLTEMKEQLATLDADIAKMKASANPPRTLAMFERIAEGQRQLIRDIEKTATPVTTSAWKFNDDSSFTKGQLKITGTAGRYKLFDGNKFVKDFNSLVDAKRHGETMFDGMGAPSRSLQQDLDWASYAEKLGRLTETGKFRDALQHIADNSENKFYRWLASALLADGTFNPKLNVYNSLHSPRGELSGRYNPLAQGHGEVMLSRSGNHHMSDWTLLHEAIHARVAHAQLMFKHGFPLPAKVEKAIKNIEELYNQVKANPFLLDQYGFKDVFEFIAEGLTNPQFQALLATISVPKFKTAWNKFVDNIRNIISDVLGMPKDHFATNNALSALLNESSTLLKEMGWNPEVAKHMYGKEGSEWLAAMTSDFSDTFGQRKAPERQPDTKKEFVNSLPKSLLDKDKDFLYSEYRKGWKAENDKAPLPIGYDNRTVDQLKEQALFRKDGSQRLDDLKPNQGYLKTGFVASQSHPVVRWTYDQIQQASVAVDNTFNKIWRNAEIVVKDYNPMEMRFTGKSLAKRVESPDSVGVQLRSLKADEGVELLRLIETYKDKDPSFLTNRELLRANGVAPKLIDALSAVKKANDLSLTELNAALAKQGFDPIGAKDSWFITNVRSGDYQVFARDPVTNKHTWLQGFDNIKDAEAVAAYLRDKEGLRDVYAASAADNIRTSKYVPSDEYIRSLSAIEDPTAREMYKAATNRAIQAAGIRKHGLMRDSKAGGYSSDLTTLDVLGPKKTWDTALKSIENYYHRVANYVGAADARIAVRRLINDDAVKDAYPNATNLSKYMFDQFIGIDRMGDDVLKEMSTVLGQINGFKWTGSNSGRNVLSNSANMFIQSQLVMLNPPFYLANGVQFVLTPAWMKQLNYKVLEGKGNVALATLRGIQDMMFPIGESKEIFAVGLEKGSLEPRFVEALDWLNSSDSKMPDAVRTATLQKVAAYADSYGRGVSYAMIYRFGESAGLSKAEAHSLAARETAGLMGVYERWARVPILNKLGPVGDAFSPLTQYITNYVGVLGELIKSGFKGDVAPLLTLLAASMAVAGIKGLPGYGDMERLWVEINALAIENGFAGQWDTPSDILDQIGMPSVAQYGIPSWSSGVDMTGTLGQGTIIGNVGQSAGLEYYWRIIESSYKSLLAAALGNQTDEQIRQNLSQVAPGVTKELVRSGMQQQSPLAPAKIYQGKAPEPAHVRTREQQLGALLTGKPSIAEKKAKDKEWIKDKYTAAQNTAISDAKNVIVEAILKDRPMGGIINFPLRVVERYPESFADISELVKKRIETANLNSYEKDVLKNKANRRLLELNERAYANVHSSRRQGFFGRESE